MFIEMPNSHILRVRLTRSISLSAVRQCRLSQMSSAQGSAAKVHCINYIHKSLSNKSSYKYKHRVSLIYDQLDNSWTKLKVVCSKKMYFESKIKWKKGAKISTLRKLEWKL